MRQPQVADNYMQRCINKIGEKNKMQCKVVSPVTGEVIKTYSIRNFRDGGSEFSVKDNLLAGEEAKYQKMIEKAGKVSATVKKPVEKIIKEVEKKQAEKPVVEPIIEEKAEPKVVEKKPQKRNKPKAIIEEKVKKEPQAPDNFNFGFF